MGKTQLNVRLPEGILEALDKRANKTGESKTDIVYKALASHLGIGSTAPDISDIVKRLEALESKFKQGTPPPKTVTTTTDRGQIDPDDFGDVITLEEMAELTGYKKMTLVSKLSRANITAVDRVDGNKAGLYSKEEVLERIGVYKR
jgi:hypothetical protein